MSVGRDSNAEDVMSTIDEYTQLMALVTIKYQCSLLQ